jgi:hypothetical protein
LRLTVDVMVCPSYGDCDAEEQDNQLTDCAEDGGVFGYVVLSFGGIGWLLVGRWRCTHAIWGISFEQALMIPSCIPYQFAMTSFIRNTHDRCTRRPPPFSTIEPSNPSSFTFKSTFPSTSAENPLFSSPAANSR